MPDFLVVYQIDVDGDTPLEAAYEAYRIMTDPESDPPVLDVYPHTGRRVDFSAGVRIDLEESERQRPAPNLGAAERLLRELVDITEAVYTRDVWDCDPYGVAKNDDPEEPQMLSGFDWPDVIALAQQSRRLLIELGLIPHAES